MLDKEASTPQFPDLPENELLETIGGDESKFWFWLIDKVRTDGDLGYAIPLMIHYNVPLYISKKLLTEDAFQTVLSEKKWLAWCASEPNWRGKLSNIKSAVTEHDDNRFQLQFEKSFCMDSQSHLLLTKFINEKEPAPTEKYSMVRIQPNDGRFEKNIKDDPSGIFHCQNGFTFNHFEVKGDLKLHGHRDSLGVISEAGNTNQKHATQTPKIDIMSVFGSTQYKRLGLLIPRREITGLAMLGFAWMQHKEQSKITDKYQDEIQLILTARSEEKIASEHFKQAITVIQGLIEWSELHKLAIHPIYAKLNEVFAK